MSRMGFVRFAAIDRDDHEGVRAFVAVALAGTASNRT